MKRLILITCFCCLSVAMFAQEAKQATDKKVSAELTALQTAAGLVKYGYENASATALIEAAKIISEIKVQELDAEVTHGTTQPEQDKKTSFSMDPKVLIADAKKYAGKDKIITAYAKKVETLLNTGNTRGAVGGPKYAESRVYGKDIDTYQVKFWANELAEVIVIGDGDNDLDLYIYDSNGNLIASDTDYTDQCVCRWVPSWTGTFTIKIVNRGAVYSNYAIATN